MNLFHVIKRALTHFTRRGSSYLVSRRRAASLIARQLERNEELKTALKRLHSRYLEAKEHNKGIRESRDVTRRKLETTREQLRKRINLLGEGDDLSKTQGWQAVTPRRDLVGAPRRGRIRVLLLDSIGGSMSRLSKALMLHEGIEADCVVASIAPRRHLVHPHETNVHGIYSHQEWREFISWALSNYDIIQTSGIPRQAATLELYDRLTELLGRRHIWRSVGFIHHYLVRQDVLPLKHYQGDLGTSKQPSPKSYLGRTFAITDTHLLTDPNVVFYSSPEKGAYLKGSDTIWLPSIRDPEDFYVPSTSSNSIRGEAVKVYVPYHRDALWKGLDTALNVLRELNGEGYNLQIITAENAGTFFPDLCSFNAVQGAEGESLAYPIPHYMMPELFRRVDLVIDQLVMGSYGNSGIEAMLCGKPVIGQKSYRELSEAPIWDVTEQNLKARICDLLEQPDLWPKLGSMGREFAISKHSPAAVARIAANTYRMILDEA